MSNPSQSEKKELIPGEIADYRLDASGILYAYSKNPKRTIENITANAALVKGITGNKVVPLLIYLCPSPVPDKATRQFAREQLPKMYKAMAMVSGPGLSRFIMNILFRLHPPPIPMKSFTDDVQAREWLTQFL